MLPRSAIVVISLLISLSAAADSKIIQGQVRIIDGDTFEFLDSGTKIRLMGIDALESDQLCWDSSDKIVECGSDSTTALDALINNGQVLCEQHDVDAYGRWIAVCWNEYQVNINAYLVQQGQALAFRKYDTRYVELERMARVERLGVWALMFVAPWDHRQQKRKAQMATAAQPADPSCVIKGNISRDGRKLYHLPNTKHYKITSIRVEQGERFFCNELQAISNGWQKAG